MESQDFDDYTVNEETRKPSFPLVHEENSKTIKGEIIWSILIIYSPKKKHLDFQDLPEIWSSKLFYQYATRRLKLEVNIKQRSQNHL